MPGSTSISQFAADTVKLNDKQKKYVAEYLKDYNQRRAAEAAGYHPNYSVRLMQMPYVLKAISNQQRRNVQEHLVTRDELIRELRNMLLRDPADIFGEDGSISDIRDIPIELRRQLDSFEVEEKLNKAGRVVGRKIKAKISNRNQAIDMLMKHLGLYAAEQHEVKHSIDWDQLYNQSNQDGPDVIEGEIAKIEEQE